jgi:methanogenic corrinoid protein MtbC1
MPDSEIDSLNQAEVEQTTGLSREVLRKWELRYGYPMPVRGERGERRYGLPDVRKLTLIKQLIGQGLRPRNLMGCHLDELQALLQAVPATAVEGDDHAAVQGLHACLRPGASPQAVKLYLSKLISDAGLSHFVHHHLPVFNRAVGDAWAKGYLGIHAEHHYTETVRALVLGLVADVRVGGTSECKRARVLLTTPPGELHGLGVLALQAALALEGADCVSLGTQTPVLDVVRAVQQWGVEVVTISASSALQPAAARNYVLALRRVLPAQCRLWVGGQGAQALPGDPMVGIEVMQTIAQAVGRWKELSSAKQGAKA